MSKDKEVVHITLSGILSWLFGIIFVLGALGSFSEHGFIAGIALLVMAVVLLPPINKMLKKKMNFELSKGLKAVIIIIAFIVFGMNINTETVASQGTVPSSNNVNTAAAPQQAAQVEKTQVPVPKEAKEPQTYYTGEKVTIGDFAYTINSYSVTDRIGTDIMGTFMGEVADGQFMVFDVTIENVAKESKTLWATSIKVIDDQQRTFEHDIAAEMYLENSDQFTFEQMQPGLPKTGKLVFDVPKDIVGALEVSSDNVFSSKKIYVSWNPREE
jgi:hypothetical protein